MISVKAMSKIFDEGETYHVDDLVRASVIMSMISLRRDLYHRRSETYYTKYLRIVKRTMSKTCVSVSPIRIITVVDALRTGLTAFSYPFIMYISRRCSSGMRGEYSGSGISVTSTSSSYRMRLSRLLSTEYDVSTAEKVVMLTM